MLSDDRIRELYETADLDAEWLGRHQRFIARIAAMEDAELLSPERQRELWLARDVTGIGPGEIVDSDQASQDQELAHDLVALRNRSWPEDVEARAQAIQGEFERLLALVTSRHSKKGNQPHAQLRRVFAALLPADLHCVVFEGGDEVHRRLLPSWSKESFVADQVLTRARLREALGPEADLDEHVKRSVFCWWLYENRETLVPEHRGTGVASFENRGTTRLALWPFPRQRKGLAARKGVSNGYREVLQVALGGAKRTEILEALGETNPDQKLKTRGQAITDAIFLGLLEERDGLLLPSQRGIDFLESETPHVLVEALLVRVFPFAHLLRKLLPGAMKKLALFSELQQIYPQWTSALAPSQALSWAKHLGLVHHASDRVELTDYGKVWEKRLPTELPSPSPVEALPIETTEEDDEDVIAEDRRAWPDFGTIWQSFGRQDDTKKLVFTKEQLASIHAAWHCNPRKRFILLSGLSGTGKTKVVQTYARLYCEHLALDPKKHLALVAVSPDWRDPSGLLGYFSALHEEPTFHVEPALRLLLDATNDPSRPYFLLLDEMNLARVERYFAPFLSAMETGDALTLHGGDDDVDGVPPRLKWPTNLFIAGTVNMDETTYPFSDKVLDRAFTFEFWDVDLDQFFENQGEPVPEIVSAVLKGLHDILKDVRRHFGYRSAEEVLYFVLMGNGEAEQRAFLDQAVFSKILPRIRGENGSGLQQALEKAETLCKREGLGRSAKKLAEMQKLLEQTGLTKFWA